MCRTAISILAIALASSTAPAMAGGTGTPPTPRLDYRMDGYQDSHVTYDGGPSGYSGRWTGTWTGADGRRHEGTWEGRFDGRIEGENHPAADDYPRPPRDIHAAPDPAYYGSGQVVGGWYYPPAVVTRTVVDYRRVR